MRAVAIWSALLIALSLPVALAAFSPLLQWRDPIYIAAGFAGIVAMAAMVVQPLAISGALQLHQKRARQVHRISGAAIVLLVVVHVAGLWLTSPPDVIDALLFRSPTPFAPWGVAAMWAVFLSAALAVLRLAGRIRWRIWQRVHIGLAAVMVIGTILHAVLILGTMEPISKYALAAGLAVSTAYAGRRIARRSR